jgi:hypothetical protein
VTGVAVPTVPWLAPSGAAVDLQRSDGLKVAAHLAPAVLVLGRQRRSDGEALSNAALNRCHAARPLFDEILSAAKWFIRHVVEYDGGFSFLGDVPCEACRCVCAI